MEACLRGIQCRVRWDAALELKHHCRDRRKALPRTMRCAEGHSKRETKEMQGLTS